MAETKPAKSKPSHPTYLEMAKEAIVSLADKKGSSVPAIQTYIAGKYNLEAEVVRQHLKPALAKGLESGTFVRPKNSDAKGYTGRFKVDKAKSAEEAKAKAKKEKEKLAKEKQALKKAAAGKSPKAKKKAVSASGEKAKKKVEKKKTPSKTKKTAAKAEKKPKAAKVLFVCKLNLDLLKLKKQIVFNCLRLLIFGVTYLPQYCIIAKCTHYRWTDLL